MTAIKGDILKPVPICPIGAVATSSILWRTQGLLHLTFIVKATFSLENGESMILDVPEEVIPTSAPAAAPNRPYPTPP